MDIEQAIYTRRSVRAFTDEPVDEPTLRRLIDAAIQAPSAVNRQPWSFTVVRDKPLLGRISDAAKVHMMAMQPATGLPPDLREQLLNPAFDIFYHAPALVVISSVLPEQWAIEDCALAAENLMLAAHARGLGTCWIGFAESWLGTGDAAAMLDLPPAIVPVAPIIVGHPKGEMPAVPRKPPVVRWIGRDASHDPAGV